MRRRLIQWTLFAACVSAVGCSGDPQVVRQKYVDSGDGYMKSGKYAEAVIEYSNAVKTDPLYGGARFKLAEAHLANGDKRTAFPEFIRAADLLKDDPEAQLRAGHLLLSGGFFEAAADRARVALKANPRNTTALVMLGNSLAGAKNLEEAVAVMQRAIQLDPERAGIYTNLAVLELAKGDRTAAEATFKQAVSVSGGAVDAQLALGTFYLAVKRWPDAEAILAAAGQQYPKHVGVNRALATLYVETNRLPLAEAALQTVADLTKDADSRVALAAFYQMSGRDADAVATLQSLGKEPAHFVRAHMELAMAYFNARRRTEAHAAIDEVLKREPRNARAVVIKARLLLADSRVADALEQANQALKFDPKLADAHLALARIYVKQRQYADAKRSFAEALAYDPSSIPARLELSALHLQDREVDSAEDLAAQAVTLSRNSLAPRLQMARVLLARVDGRQRADAEIRALVTSFPRVAGVHLLMASLALQRNDTVVARQAFERALEIDPGSLDAVAGLVALDITQGKPADALRRAEALAATRPDDSAVLLLVANAYGFSGDAARAEATLRAALKVDPSNPSISSLLGALYIRQNRVDAAIAEFKEVIRIEPRSVGAATLLGLLHYAKHDRPLARQWWSRALEIDPRAAAAANNLAWLYAESREQLDLALPLALTARDAYPHVPEVLDTVGWVYFQQKLPRISEGYFKQSIEIDPKNPLYHYHLGKVYADRGEDLKARRSMEQALTLDPNFPQAPDARKTIEGLLF